MNNSSNQEIRKYSVRNIGLVENVIPHNDLYSVRNNANEATKPYLLRRKKWWETRFSTKPLPLQGIYKDLMMNISDCSIHLHASVGAISQSPDKSSSLVYDVDCCATDDKCCLTEGKCYPTNAVCCPTDDECCQAEDKCCPTNTVCCATDAVCCPTDGECYPTNEKFYLTNEKINTKNTRQGVKYVKYN